MPGQLNPTAGTNTEYSETVLYLTEQWLGVLNAAEFYLLLYIVRYLHHHGTALTPLVLSLLPLGVGLYIVRDKGLDTIVRHATLRFLLHHNGSSPRNYADFLDFCSDHILMRKVGGGYIFIHRLLLEHLAAKYTSEEK